MHLRHVGVGIVLAFALGACGDDDAGTVVPVDSGTPLDAMTEKPSSSNEVVFEQEVMLVNGFSQVFSFNVPADSASLAISIEGSEPNLYSIGYWVDGAGKELVPSNWFINEGAMCQSCPSRVFFQESVSGGLAPNSEMSEFSAGKHSFSIFAAGSNGQALPSGNATVRVTRKKGVGIPTTGKLNLNIYLSGAGGYTKENAASNPQLQKILNELRTVYTPAGLTIGDIHFFDVGSEYRMIAGASGAGNQLHKLFREGKASTQTGVNLFLVDEVMLGGFGGFGVLLGVSGGIPGPTGSHGSDRGGVAIALTPHATGLGDGVPVPVARTIGHEIGHHLGLFHSKEQLTQPGVPANDPIADSPENDPNNLMYFNPKGDSLSPWQAKVMRANPWVQH